MTSSSRLPAIEEEKKLLQEDCSDDDSLNRLRSSEQKAQNEIEAEIISEEDEQ